MKLVQSKFLCNVLKNMAPSYYAVATGHTPGIYTTWDQCKKQVYQYSGSVYKKFSSQADAEKFIQEHTNPNKQNMKKNIKTTPARPYLHRDESSEVKEKPPLKRIKLIDLPTSSPGTSSNYIIDEDGFVNVYTDGACSSNGMKNPRAGIGVWFGDNHPLNVSQPVVGRATNNNAEIQAVTAAVKQAKMAGIKKLKINTDSKFLICCIQEWMPRWKVNGWKTAGNKPVINKKELLELETSLNSLDVTWNHINGHVGIYGNEMADALAKAGSSKY